MHFIAFDLKGREKESDPFVMNSLCLRSNDFNDKSCETYEGKRPVVQSWVSA